MGRWLIWMAAALLVACGGDDTQSKDSDKGREETRTIRNTEAIGYAGDAIADKVDDMLDENDERMKKLQEAEEASE